jgi:hypothetical protein
MARALREPLVHFLVFGALLFAADHALNGRANDPHQIVVGPEVTQEINTLFRNAMSRDPSDGEMKQLRERWIDNEVLYREGLAMGVDQGDPTIRDRVIFKTLTVVEANIKAPTIDEPGLVAWFEQNKSKYGEPARIDFLEAVLVGDKSEAAIRAFVTALNSGEQNDTQGGLRVYKGRPRDNIVAGFGADFTNALEKLAPGVWQAVPSSEGLRVVRLEGARPAEVVEFAAVRPEVLMDWKDARMADLRTQAVREVGKKYDVSVVAAPSTEGAVVQTAKVEASK